MKRKTNTVKDLAKWISADLAKHGRHTSLEIGRDWSLESHLSLAPRTAEALTTLHERLTRAIPDDFNFFITFEDGEIFGELEFQNGMMAAAGRELPARPDRNFIENIRNLDWDELRSDAMSMTESLERSVSGPVPDWFKEHIASKRNN